MLIFVKVKGGFFSETIFLRSYWPFSPLTAFTDLLGSQYIIGFRREPSEWDLVFSSDQTNYDISDRMRLDGSW